MALNNARNLAKVLDPRVELGNLETQMDALGSKLSHFKADVQRLTIVTERAFKRQTFELDKEELSNALENVKRWY